MEKSIINKLIQKTCSNELSWSILSTDHIDHNDPSFPSFNNEWTKINYNASYFAYHENINFFLITFTRISYTPNPIHNGIELWVQDPDTLELLNIDVPADLLYRLKTDINIHTAGSSLISKLHTFINS